MTPPLKNPGYAPDVIAVDALVVIWNDYFCYRNPDAPAPDGGPPPPKQDDSDSEMSSTSSFSDED